MVAKPGYEKVRAMSVHGKKGVGLPTILLHEGEAHTITVELLDGTLYRGELMQSEDTWNMMMKNVTVTTSEGVINQKLNTIYIRGNQIRFVILPDVLQYAPMFERVRAFKRGITMPGSGVPDFHEKGKVFYNSLFGKR